MPLSKKCACLAPKRHVRRTLGGISTQLETQFARPSAASPSIECKAHFTVEQALENALANALGGSLFGSIFGSGADGGLLGGLFSLLPLPAFASGAWSLPTDMIAQVHAGETIVPAGPAAALRSAVASRTGGGDTHVHVRLTHSPVISAIDGASVQRFFKNNEKAMVRQLNDGVRRGAHLGLSNLGAT
jgi:hypothetical protein